MFESDSDPEVIEVESRAVQSKPKSKSKPKPKPKAKPKPRVQRPLKQSIINRICKLPSDTTNKTKVEAELVYTNSQYGLEREPCTRPTCRCCPLAPRKARTVKAMSERTVARRKQRTQAFQEKRRNGQLPTAPQMQCICAELDGQLFKLLDVPVKDVEVFSYIAGANLVDR